MDVVGDDDVEDVTLVNTNFRECQEEIVKITQSIMIEQIQTEILFQVGRKMSVQVIFVAQSVTVLH